MDTSDFPTLLPAGFPLDQIVARLLAQVPVP